jgi:hypothetical protein
MLSASTYLTRTLAIAEPKPPEQCRITPVISTALDRCFNPHVRKTRPERMVIEQSWLPAIPPFGKSQIATFEPKATRFSLQRWLAIINLPAPHNLFSRLTEDFRQEFALEAKNLLSLLA